MRPLRILTWNTWLQSDFTSDPDPNPKKRAPLIGEKLRACDRDILLLQKVWKERDTLIEAILPSFPFISKKINSGPGFNLHSGLLTASRFPLALLGTVDFKDTLGIEGTFANKGAALWSGEWEGAPFQIVSLHLQGEVADGKAHLLPETRRSELRQVREELLDRHFERGVPQIICGDFVMDSSGEDFAEASRILGTEEEAHPVGRIPCTAYGRDDGDFPNDIGRVFQNRPERLDHVLLRRNESDLEVTIDRTIRKRTAPWKSRLGKTYHDLAYRYALEADIVMEPVAVPGQNEDEDVLPTVTRIALEHLA